MGGTIRSAESQTKSAQKRREFEANNGAPHFVQSDSSSQIAEFAMTLKDGWHQLVERIRILHPGANRHHYLGR